MKQVQVHRFSVFIALSVIVGILLGIILGVRLCKWVIADEITALSKGGLLWNEVRYEETWGQYQKGAFIEKTSNGYYIYEVVGDQQRNFVVVVASGFFIGPSDNDILMVRKDYEFTTNEVTRVQDSEDLELCRTMQEILTNDSEIFFDPVFDNSPWMEILIYHDHCPLGFSTTLAYVQEQYVLVEEVYDERFDSIDNQEFVYQCKVIDEKHLPILRKHLGGILDAAVADAKEREAANFIAIGHPTQTGGPCL